MNNHYAGKALHEAHRQDLMNEAKGGWLVKQAREGGTTPRKPNVIRWLLPIILVGAVMVLGVLQFAPVP